MIYKIKTTKMKNEKLIIGNTEITLVFDRVDLPYQDKDLQITKDDGYRNKNTSLVIYSFSDFREVSIDKIAQYLPKGHSDLLMPRYVKLLPGFDNNHTGEVFITSGVVPCYKGWDMSYTWKYLLSGPYKRYFEPSTEEMYNL